ncbi:SDR family oxidoreductase [Herbidospora galbida]|uniref:SDR family oxidoreductase n=1 Tax=Herbidospora galbida TaxID=2575442 RepID=A0A4U3MIM6_9ACTN|nr:SDR family oxidoreductase [Herbidospora galbida]TKK89225.1 SDR family oxidoreductase [Herbidospora galbida]
MRVFVTGASGWIGSALVPELLAKGHDVVGLARSDASAEALGRAGAEVVRGTLDDLGLLREAAAASDGVVHLAFKHDVAFSGGFAEAAGADRAAVEALVGALGTTGRPFVLASGLLGLAPGRVGTERDLPGTSESPLHRRAQTARWVLEQPGVRASVLRLPPTVHGAGDNGFIAFYVAASRAAGHAGYVGEARWPAVHRSDAARLFVLALERAPAGSVLHAVQDEGVPFRDVAEAVGKGLDVPVASLSPEEAAVSYSWLAPMIAADSPASSALTREALSWEPTGPGLLEDLVHYLG